MRFEEGGVVLPEALGFRFDEVLTEREIISACEGADFLLVPPAYPDITPHIAGVTRGAVHRMLRGAIANILKAFAGKPSEHVVNGVWNLRGKSLG